MMHFYDDIYPSHKFWRPASMKYYLSIYTLCIGILSWAYSEYIAENSCWKSHVIAGIGIWRTVTILAELWKEQNNQNYFDMCTVNLRFIRNGSGQLSFCNWSLRDSHLILWHFSMIYWCLLVNNWSGFHEDIGQTFTRQSFINLRTPD